MPTLIIGDLHGDHAALRALLRDSGAIDADTGHKRPEWAIYQLGDLLHGDETSREADLECLKLGLHYCDAIAIGNHELPLLYPDKGFPQFLGRADPLPETARLLRYAAAEGWLVPALAWETFLLSHAGVNPDISTHVWGATPEAGATMIRQMLRQRLLSDRPCMGIFDAVGRARGGQLASGGIFWQDWREFLPHLRDPQPHVAQIIGHTPLKEPLCVQGTWAIDLGPVKHRRVAALIFDPASGQHWQRRPAVVIHDRSASEADPAPIS